MSIPVHLITGLLGSGKTHTLQHLLQQKPEQEHWGLIINEFGTLDIDAATLHRDKTHLSVIEIRGGCLCCSAQQQMLQSVQQLLKQTEQLDRIWIEASGLGHPAQMHDLLKQLQHHYELQLQRTLCIITPKQLTTERWQKSKVMRDLVTLADMIVLNQCDLSTDLEIEQAKQLLNQYKPSFAIDNDTQFIQQSENLTLAKISGRPTPKFFLSLASPTLRVETIEVRSELPHCQALTLQFESVDQQRTLIGLAWLFSADALFMRPQLKQAFLELNPLIARLKGIVRTGKEWQRFDWLEGHVQLQEIAWRQDSRIECLLNSDVQMLENLSTEQIQHKFEHALNHCIHRQVRV